MTVGELIEKLQEVDQDKVVEFNMGIETGRSYISGTGTDMRLSYIDESTINFFIVVDVVEEEE